MDVQTTTTTTTPAMKRVFLAMSCLTLAVGICGGPLITRLYFLHGGKRMWFSSWLQTGGWPLILAPLLVAYTRRRHNPTGKKIFYIKPRILTASLVIGTLTGLGNYIYVYGLAQLPVSTSSLILASQLAFTAAFAFLLVKQKFTAYSVNAVVMLTVASAILGINTGGDRPAGESSKEYLVGFVMMVGTAILFGFLLPLVELTYKKAKQAVTFTLVLEMQLVIGFVATAFCTVAMIINKDFQAISREAKAYELGKTNYYLVVISSAIMCQCFSTGALGVIFYSSSLLSGIVIAALLPVTELLAVIFYHEKFQAEKGVSLFLSMWGFISYFYGEIKLNNNNNNNSDNKSENMNMNRTDEETELALRTIVAP
ncbi:hypothetical protein CASFOL_025972 [Castilleja foliolosa]|uniref:Probable purine permease n=1 Tax=Castilleja foliolosa TaxID=1961234 RepID=A0ABD3CTI6_9LAMI